MRDRVSGATRNTDCAWPGAAASSADAASARTIRRTIISSPFDFPTVHDRIRAANMPARQLFDRFFPKSAPEPEQLVLDYAGASLPVTFLRSARARRASLRVDPAHRRIVLTAPTRMARSVALGFAQSQAGWIAARLKRLPARRPFVDGAELPLFGATHLIRHRPDARGTVWVEGGEIHVAGRPEHLPRRLRDWLMAEMRRRLPPLIHAKAIRVERTVKRITVRDSRSRWGSCGPDGGRSCSWRPGFAPAEVLD